MRKKSNNASILKRRKYTSTNVRAVLIVLCPILCGYLVSGSKNHILIVPPYGLPSSCNEKYTSMNVS